MKVLKRDEISENFKWNLEDIYKSEEDLESDLKKIETLKNESLKLEGNLLNNRDNILKAFKLDDEINYLFDHLFCYASMKLDQDCTQNKNKALLEKLSNVYTKINTALAFISPEVVENSVEFLEKLSNNKDFKDYDYSLKRIIKDKTHTLSTKEETILVKSQKITGLFSDAFHMFDDADVKFEDFIDSNGDTIQLSHGIYGLILQTGKREDREKAFNSMFNAYKQNIDVISTLYKGNLEQDYFYASIRKYKSCLDKATSDEDVTMDVYYKLIENIHKNLPLLHKHMSYRKKTMKYKELHMWDLHVPTVDNVDKEINYDEAKNMVLKALKPLGDEYQGLLNRAFSERWIDIYENKGKRSGAYSTGCYGVHPYVLLNYQPTLNEVFTIAHELGHSMHTYYSNLNQPFSKANYEIFVAEVASTVNETLLVMDLLKEAKGDYKKYLLSYLLNMFRTTVFRQAQFAEFEEKAHKLVENDEPITSDVLCDIYYDLNKEYYGEDVVSDKLIKYEWARIPHFYRSFYVYKYSTGLISAVCIAKNILEKGENYVENYYKKFLSAGGSMSPVEILKLAQVDLTSDEPYTKAMNFYKETLEELDRM